MCACAFVCWREGELRGAGWAHDSKRGLSSTAAEGMSRRHRHGGTVCWRMRDGGCCSGRQRQAARDCSCAVLATKGLGLCACVAYLRCKHCWLPPGEGVALKDPSSIGSDMLHGSWQDASRQRYAGCHLELDVVR